MEGVANPHIRDVVELHFDDERGAPFWKNKKTELSFDPITEIETFEDLVLFKEDPSYDGFPEELMKETPRDLIPDGLDDYRLFSTGGRTGQPKWTAVGSEKGWNQMQTIADQISEKTGISSGRDWLYIGPTGPHLFGWAIAELADRHDGNYLTIDLDPRWIRETKTNPELQRVDESYLGHLQTQTRSVLETFGRDIGVLVSTPSVIEMMVETGALDRLNLDAVLFAGQAIKPENYQVLNQQLDCSIQGWYGNTLFGAIPQEGFREGVGVIYPDQTELVKLEIIDPNSPKSYEPIEYEERGRILAHIVREGLFAPYHLEDDAATKLKSEIEDIDLIGHPDVPQQVQDKIEEGVY